MDEKCGEQDILFYELGDHSSFENKSFEQPIPVYKFEKSWAASPFRAGVFSAGVFGYKSSKVLCVDSRAKVGQLGTVISHLLPWHFYFFIPDFLFFS